MADEEVDLAALIDTDGDGIISNEELLNAKSLVDTDGDGIISSEELQAAKKKYYKKKSHWCSICIVNLKGQFIPLMTPSSSEPSGQVASFFCDCDDPTVGECKLLNNYINMPTQQLCNMQLVEDDSVNSKTMEKYLFTNLRDKNGEIIKAKNVIKHFESAKYGGDAGTKTTTAAPGIYIYVYHNRK